MPTTYEQLDRQYKIRGLRIKELETERDYALREMYDSDVANEGLANLIKNLRSEHDRLLEAIRESINYAGNRWSEWGYRAEGCLKILEAALASQPQLEGKEK